MTGKDLVDKILKYENLGGHARFYELLLEIAELHARKNANYAEDNDPLSNLKYCANFGIRPFIGVMVRLSDKWSRITQLAKGKPDLVGESIKDTLFDNAVYSLLSIILLEEENKNVPKKIT